jgi:hypothetical protein
VCRCSGSRRDRVRHLVEVVAVRGLHLLTVPVGGTVTAECALVTRSCGVPLRGLGSGFTAHGRRFARAGLTWARQASSICRSGPPSPALALELLTNGAVVPTGPQLAYPGQSRGLTCAASLSSWYDKLEHTRVHSNTPTRQQSLTLRRNVIERLEQIDDGLVGTVLVAPWRRPHPPITGPARVGKLIVSASSMSVSRNQPALVISGPSAH